jgi:nucleoside-diphosphate-sugar epimerase
MRILVTGGNGFIGSYLLPRLAEAGHVVFHPGEAEMDLRSLEDVEAAVKRFDPEAVIHLAAKTEVAWSFDDYEDVSDVNYIGTVRLAEACRKYCTDFKMFLMASTMETYGHQPHKPFTEETPQMPMAPYAVAKVAAEKYLHYMEYAYDFPYVILRQTNTYGRDRNDFFVMERIITQMLAGDVCNLGEPDPVRNFLWIDDLIDLYMVILEKMPIGETFVTGPKNGLTIQLLVNMIRNKLDWDGALNWHTIPKRPGEIYYLNSDPIKARILLGWWPKVPLNEGIDRTIELWRSR